MPEPKRDTERSDAEITTAVGHADDRAELPMEEEEKVLAGRTDANMPSLLTKDVPGG